MEYMELHHRYGGSLSKMGVPPVYHPFIDGIFYEINHPAMGVPHLWKVPNGEFQSGNATLWNLWPLTIPLNMRDVTDRGKRNG